ncbi:putative cytochrome P450 [Massariosphaeria phaeospora]|uniref:Putative cytochrome P450 n=1 Tax=Massariosphaeria phaeospora TaxID=100035 RepID=A0A7C8M843_9PLEO|nr:putative cytochrome P450 [Massariosphaeria phaeospora]
MSFLITTIIFATLAYFVATAYTSRKVIRNLQKQGKPMPPFSWMLGHLHIIKKYVGRFPSDAILNYAALDIFRDYSEHGIFYMDFWPFNVPLLVVGSPFAAAQVMQHINIPKPVTISDAFLQMTGGPSLITMPETTWKRWRSIFAPGFSEGYMLEQVHKIVEVGEIFCAILRRNAEQGQVFQFEEATIRLAIDVIALIGMDMKLDYQRQDSMFADGMRSLIDIVTFGAETNLIRRWNPTRPFFVWYYGRIIDATIHRELEKRFSEHNDSFRDSNRAGRYRQQNKSIVALALDNHAAGGETTVIDDEFKRYATAQIRLFFVTGHDTTSSTITYAVHLLHKHPKILARVRAEHDDVFGEDVSATPRRLVANPNLLNRLPLTLAAIKETLRLFPPAGGARMGSPDLELISEDGTRFPTANCAIWIMHEAFQRNPAYWPEPDSYIPDRWLVDSSHPYYPVKGAWRVFESGPRNCIGQTLAIAEMKTVLVLMLREFSIQPAYEEWDKLHPTTGVKTVDGERAYQVSGGGGGEHPANQYPCRVTVCQR